MGQRTTMATSRFLFWLAALLLFHPKEANGLSPVQPNRRDALEAVVQSATTAIKTATVSSFVSACTCSIPTMMPLPAHAANRDSTQIPNRSVIVPITNKNRSGVLEGVPKIGYSFYKTDPSQVERCTELALQAGVKHFDVATQYGTNDIIGRVFNRYLNQGNWNETVISPRPKTRQARRDELFVTHKLSNREQSTDIPKIKRSVQAEIAKLNLSGYLDCGMIHSPLTVKNQRLCTYQALLELQQQGVLKSVGVANYGVGPLNEIVESGMPPPSIIQLQLSPFNQHKDVVAWAESHGSVICCNAWSKLSSATGPQDGWAVIADIAKNKSMTKAQVLIQWSFQKSYLCVPRSGSKSNIQRQAILENSFAGLENSFYLHPKEMETLNRLDQQWPAGQLGCLDGWSVEDVLSDSWDPTLAM